MICYNCAQSTTSAIRNYGEPKEGGRQLQTSRTPPIRRQQRVQTERLPIREDLELVNNYSTVVRNGREKMRLTHDELSRKIGEKVSVLQKLETGKMIPNHGLVKKLEQGLKIKLLQPASRVTVDEEFRKKPSDLTLGDLILIKQKRTDKAEEQQKRG
jgi:putative transcription factor